ncbi:NF-kappa-B inhibitor cactus-like [Anoplophora glabripennis]|uniref:NF-kappa-B inhibitor cactus-like n=1 Tax=Anoplophora glabripennis TaxID=217634 RepID=UPI0008755EC9|nr:NF-kappa-B inhibitor cactus-like [Anoplophora glabripennis]
MSQKQNSNFPDAPGKVTDDDNCGLYESSRTDSGFISSGNLLVSGEIVSEEIQSVSGIPENTSSRPLTLGVVEEKEKDTDYMRLDSGVCLSESFSNLNIKQGFNDLNCPKIKQTPVESYIKSDLQKQVPVVKVSDDIPWKIYYEQDDDGDTHLHTAIVEGFVEVALALIRAAPHPRLLDTPNDDAQTPLHLAVETAQWRIARWLVVAGARPCPRDLQGDSPLHIAARAGDVKSIKAIADPVQQQERDALALSYQGHMYQPCDLDQWNYLGQTCAHVAALHGHVEVLRHLVWYGVDINAREGCMGYTALHYAVERRDEATVQFLLHCEKLNVEVETYGGRNALEINRIIPPSISQALRKRGVPSPYSSDDSDDEIDIEDSGDELTQNSRMFSVPMVNASA